MDKSREESFEQQIDARQMCGQFLTLAYSAWLGPEPLDCGLNPVTLYKGGGRIVQLTLYERLAPGLGGLRRVAHYNQGWRFGRRRYGALLALLVESLEAGRFP